MRCLMPTAMLFSRGTSHKIALSMESTARTRKAKAGTRRISRGRFVLLRVSSDDPRAAWHVTRELNNPRRAFCRPRVVSLSVAQPPHWLLHDTDYSDDPIVPCAGVRGINLVCIRFGSAGSLALCMCECAADYSRSTLSCDCF